MLNHVALPIMRHELLNSTCVCTFSHFEKTAVKHVQVLEHVLAKVV